MRLPGIMCLTGIDGCGKSVQQEMLANWIDAREDDGKKCFRLSFPSSDTALGTFIREFLRGESAAVSTEASKWEADPELNATVLQCMMTVNRLEFADEIERANVVEGRSVVLSRYWADAVAYGAADGLSPTWLEAIHSRLPKAHHVLIDVPVEESFKRRPKRDDAYETDRGRLERARDAYLDLFFRKGCDAKVWSDHGYQFAASPSGWYIVDGVGTEDEVHARIQKALDL